MAGAGRAALQSHADHVSKNHIQRSQIEVRSVDRYVIA